MGHSEVFRDLISLIKATAFIIYNIIFVKIGWEAMTRINLKYKSTMACVKGVRKYQILECTYSWHHRLVKLRHHRAILTTDFSTLRLSHRLIQFSCELKGSLILVYYAELLSNHRSGHLHSSRQKKKIGQKIWPFS